MHMDFFEIEGSNELLILKGNLNYLKEFICIDFILHKHSLFGAKL